MYLCEARAFTSTKRIHCNRLNAKEYLRIRLSSVKSGIKEICENVKHCHSPHIITFGGKCGVFGKNVIYGNVIFYYF